MPKTITPHKGGRTERVPFGRLTPQERKTVELAVKLSGHKSFSDWVVEMANTEVSFSKRR